MYHERVRPTTSIKVRDDGLEEHTDVLRVKANEDGPRLEDQIHGIEVAVAGDLLEEDGRCGVELVVRYLDDLSRWQCG